MRTKNRKVPKIKTLVESLPKLINRDEVEFCKIWAESLHNTCVDSGVWNTIYVEIPKRSDIWQDWNTDDRGKTRKVWADCSSISFETVGGTPKIELEFLEVDYNENTNRFTWVDEDLRGHPAAVFRCDIDKLFSSNSAEIDPEDPILEVYFGQDLHQALEDCVKEKYRLYKQANNKTTTLGKTSTSAPPPDWSDLQPCPALSKPHSNSSFQFSCYSSPIIFVCEFVLSNSSSRS